MWQRWSVHRDWSLLGATTADAAKFTADETQLWDRVITENHLTLE